MAAFPAQLAKVASKHMNTESVSQMAQVLEIQVGEILSNGHQVPPIFVDAEMNVAQASAVLAKHGISSAPIKKQAGFCGMFDFADLAELLLLGMKRRGESRVELDAVLQSGLSTTSPVRLVSDLSNRNPMVSIKATDTVGKAIAVLLSKSLHRLCVFDESGPTFAGMLSFSDVLKLLHDNVASLDSLLAPSVASLGLATKSVCQISGDRPVIEALQIMVEKKVSSVAVVDEVDGTLLTAITLSDCKNLVKLKRLDRMRLDCREFAAQVRAKQSLDDIHGRETFPFFAVHRDTSLKKVVAKLVAVRAHRLFVVDDNKPVGVIELPDIFAALALED